MEGGHEDLHVILTLESRHGFHDNRVDVLRSEIGDEDLADTELATVHENAAPVNFGTGGVRVLIACGRSA